MLGQGATHVVNLILPQRCPAPYPPPRGGEPFSMLQHLGTYIHTTMRCNVTYRPYCALPLRAHFPRARHCALPVPCRPWNTWDKQPRR